MIHYATFANVYKYINFIQNIVKKIKRVIGDIEIFSLENIKQF